MDKENELAVSESLCETLQEKQNNLEKGILLLTENNKSLESKVVILQKEKESLTTKVRALETSQNKVDVEIEGLMDDLEELQENKKRLNKETEEKDMLIQSMQQKSSTLMNKLEQLEEAMKGRLFTMCGSHFKIYPTYF